MSCETNAIDFLARGAGAACCVNGEILVKALYEVRAERDRLKDALAAELARAQERPRD